ncbi:MAG TPA: diadenylate cyclase [Vicinamibacterales bacterium]|nr:diadenylate cyclase [Vicinamibacterales bacterium]
MTEDSDSAQAIVWAELERRGSINPRYLVDIEGEIAAELVRCFEPVIHEQDVRPYGAIVARERPNIEQLGRLLPTDGLPDDVIHSLADGRQTLTIVAKGQRLELLLLNEPMDTEQDFASHAVWVDGVIVANDNRGVVRIVTDSSITVVQGRRWMTKDLVYEAAEDIMQIRPSADARVVRKLLELTHHRISPARIGATILYRLGDAGATTKGRDAGVALARVGLSVLNDAEHPIFVHLARYHDGALLVGRDGHLEAVNVIIRPSSASERAVPAMKGTRHTSAARHSHDVPDVLAFVVSTDGPVTVFSGGHRVADLKKIRT